ncbi:MAG: molybdate ABC transporter substrate-binding protein [Pseudomonadota bacterium]
MTLDEAPKPLRIAVAANFRSAAQALLAASGLEEQLDARVSSAASGVLAAQISNGAPFDLFLSADRERPAALSAAGIGQKEPVCYARGRLALMGAANLQGALADPALSIAIANPRTAPYGQAAASVLARPGFANVSQRRVLRAANVQQALQFFDSGASDLALVARSVAGDRGLEIPQSMHPPIDQYALILSAGRRGKHAERFLRFLGTTGGRETLETLGYEACP